MAVAGIIVGKSFITLMVDGTTHTVTEQHPNYAAIREAVKTKQLDGIESLINISSKVAAFGDGKVTVDNGRVLYEGEELHGAVVDRILDMIREGFDADPMLAFLENLMKNPSKRAVDELYLWLEKTSLPITEDGYFLAYKKVRDDYKDYYTGTMDNSVGQVLEMPRNKVDDNRDQTCSYGLHFCSLSYLPSYYGGQGKVMIVKVNPADVVSIPSDYNNAKGRACRYEVIGEHVSETTEAFNTPVWTDLHEDEDDFASDDDEFPDEARDTFAEGYDDGYEAAQSGFSYEPDPYDQDSLDDCSIAEYRRGYAKGWKERKVEEASEADGDID